MECIKNKWRDLSLRKAFMLTVFLTMTIIIMLSVITIVFCLRGRHYLLPDARSVWLTVEKKYNDWEITESIKIPIDEENWESPISISSGVSEEHEGESEKTVKEDSKEVSTDYKITKAEDSFCYLSPKRKMAYRILGVSIIVFPTIYAIIGILLCALWFYKHKLSRPIRKLENAIGQIQKQNLDFQIVSEGKDELEKVCFSFEEMRRTLYENNQSMWNMLEERRRLQASVAHDLRNPITIVQTYAEYLKLYLVEENPSEELGRIVENLQAASKRMEQYTDSIRDISKLEELEINPVLVNLAEVLPDMEEELSLLAKSKNKKFRSNMLVEEIRGIIDISALYRILENLVTNASRYASETIQMDCTIEEGGIIIRISDDGPGFSPKVLSQKKAYFTTNGEDGHMGMGLSICRILCRKLGGKIELYNRKDGGAEAKIILKA